MLPSKYIFDRNELQISLVPPRLGFDETQTWPQHIQKHGSTNQLLHSMGVGAP